MKTYKVPHSDLVVSRIAYGCAGLAAWNAAPVTAEEVSNAEKTIRTAYDQGVTIFDTADCYAYGKSETTLGRVLKQSPGLREKITIVSKCGQILPERLDGSSPIRVNLSREHIVKAAEGTLKRLQSDYLDILLLHAPDALMEPEEIATAFEELHAAGKVRYFGVSNFGPAQLELLRRYLRRPLVANQIHLSLVQPQLLAAELELQILLTKGALGQVANAFTGTANAGVVDYCRLHDIQIQVWSPLRGDLLKPVAEVAPEFAQTASLLARLAEEKSTTPSTVALAWLLRHPAGIVPVIGATNPKHIVENCAADSVNLSANEWYDLFASAAKVRINS